MYRKRSGSGYSKRRTNIYDPQGVYKKGLTKKQKTGMSNQVKLQYLEVPKPRITRSLLDEYKKVLQFYGIPTVARFREISLSIDCSESSTLTINSDLVLNMIRGIGIEPMSFVVNSFTLKRKADGYFPESIVYDLHYGNGHVSTSSNHGSTESSYDRTEAAVPGLYRSISDYYVKYTLNFDLSYTDVSLNSNTQTSIPSGWTDLANTSVGDIIPYTQYKVYDNSINCYTSMTVTLHNNSPLSIILNTSVVY